MTALNEPAAVDVSTEWDTAVLDALDDPACDDCETGYLLNDPERLATIDRLGLHGHLGDPHLDAVVATVAAGCDVPRAVVNIVTPDLQTYPAELGVGSCSTAVPDGLSFCAEVVRTRKALVVADAPSHPVYGANPLVVAGVIGAYAGEPLVYGEHVIGTLSIFDSVPREFTTSDLDLLRAQAQLVTAAVRLRALEAWDPLTGLGNRPMLLERAGRALLERTDGHAVALLVLDVIGMRDLNATMGTPAGDLLLKDVAGRIRGACGPADSVARIGGDEFAVLLDHVASGDDARARAASICAAVRGHVEVQGVSLVVDIRWGLTTSHAVTADELLVAAERAAFEVLTAPDQTGTQQPPDDGAELAAAIDNGELVLHYHPVVELSTGTVTGVEALVRWQHPTRGLLMPLHFIPLAEASGLIVQLGDWVLRTGAAQAHEWASRGLLLDVAINLSPLQMAAPSFADHCLAVLAPIEAPVERIVLEVTESALLDQPHAREGLIKVRRSGVRLALDDFGTGYSSFSYLRQFPIDIIKIDRSFVSGLGENADDDAIVASVVGLARNTGKSIIAEGVETTAQLLHLRNLGVDAAQGFLWTRPLPADSLERWIEANQQAGWALPGASPSLPPGSRRPFSPDEVEILQMHVEGASLHTIAAALNGAGSRTSVGMRWHARSVAQVISPPVPLRRPHQASHPPPRELKRPIASTG